MSLEREYIADDFYKVYLGNEIDQGFHKYLQLKIVGKGVLFFDMWPKSHPDEKPQFIIKGRVHDHCPIETHPELYL